MHLEELRLGEQCSELIKFSTFSVTGLEFVHFCETESNWRLLLLNCFIGISYIRELEENVLKYWCWRLLESAINQSRWTVSTGGRWDYSEGSWCFLTWTNFSFSWFIVQQAGVECLYIFYWAEQQKHLNINIKWNKSTETLAEKNLSYSFWNRTQILIVPA